MNRHLRITSYLVVSVSSVIATIVIIGFAYAVYYFLFGIAVQTLPSRESGHVAVLREHFGIIDYNRSVDVNGKSVYRSGDIQGISPTQLRATLVWDKTGRVVMLETMGKPAFAYDVVKDARVGNSYLANLDFYPMPEDFRFTELGD